MKRQFGSFWSRLLSGGVKLSVAEHAVLEALVSGLPDELRQVAELQFEAYNLVQREVDGRALNFYRNLDGQPSNMQGLPLLQHKGEEAPLVRITLQFNAPSPPLHAVLTAVHGRAFCISFSRALTPGEATTRPQVGKVVQAWRSNF